MAFIEYHRDYHHLHKMWQKCRDVLLGEDRIKERSQTYLPKLRGQDDNDYAAYLLRGAFYNATFKTSAALSGMAVRKMPRVVDSTPAVNSWLSSSFDEYGHDVWRFTTRLVEEKVNTGRVGVLVDWKPLGGNGTLADQASKTPYVTMYKAEQIINWHWTENRLDLVILQTIEEEFDSFDYGTEEVEYQLVLSFDENGYYKQDTYRDGAFQKTVYPLRNGQKLREIPFFFLDMDDTADKPPLYDIVNLNLRHYRLYADFAHLLHFTSIPTLVITGAQLESGQELAIGSEKAMVFTNPEATATWIKAGSDGAEPIKAELLELENRMAAIGAQILQDRVDRETAQAAQLRNAYNTSFLSLLVQEISTVVTQVIMFGAWWMGKPLPDSFRFELDTDFNTVPLPAAELQVLVQAYQAGTISLETFIYNLERGEYLPPGTDINEEMERIEAAEPQPTQFALELTGSTAPRQVRQPKGVRDDNEPR